MKDRKLLWVALAFFAAAALVACGGATPTTASSPPPVQPATRGSSSLDPNAAKCLVSTDYLTTMVDGHSTGGYFSADDKGVTLLIKHAFVPGTDDGTCPQPTRGNFSLASNGAACGLTGPEGLSFAYVDCDHPGKSQAQAVTYYPDGSTDIVRLDLNVG